MRFPIEGVRIGHWTDNIARTGCTVVLLPAGTIASGEIRGGSPATREFDLLSPERTVDRLDAVVLTGGSAFGLASAGGVVDYLEEEGVGYPTGAGPVPIVVAMGLFDLMEGDARVRPGLVEGRAAAAAASGEFMLGQVGAGTGATIGTWRGRNYAFPGGIGFGAADRDGVTVASIVAVNAAGELNNGLVSAAIANGTYIWPTDSVEAFEGPLNTTIGLIVTNAILSKGDCLLAAQAGHDGLARALFPAHLSSDGDALVFAATGGVEAMTDLVRVLAASAVERAVRVACEPVSLPFNSG